VYRSHPHSHQLQFIKEGDQRERAAYLSLEQVLAAHACVAFSMIADLEMAGRIFGNRGYRYAHFEAGMIGQVLYLGAEALGLNATGMGAFYDNEVHKYLGIPPEQGQVIYHFAVGRAVSDDRLITVGEEPGLVSNEQKTPDCP
jgi:SagB-type dehydrogenase family enzyme